MSNPSIPGESSANQNVPPLVSTVVSMTTSSQSQIPVGGMKGNITFECILYYSIPPESIPPSMTASPPQPAPVIQKEKFDSALDFLDQVKLQFSHNPKVYSQFLEIMKDFKAQW
jgi:histone deacetylase complex regulatory component SIN3